MKEFRMKTFWGSITAVALLLVFNAPAYSEEEGKPEENIRAESDDKVINEGKDHKNLHAIKGKVQSIDGDNIVIELKMGHKTLVANDKAIFHIEGKDGTIKDLKAGMYILVENQHNSKIAVRVFASETDKKVGAERKQEK
jgi:hypothetical protein